jgi:hypothetical protein
MASKATAPASKPRLSGKRRCSCRQEQGNKRWLDRTPEFGGKSHDVQAEAACTSLMAQLVLANEAYWLLSPFDDKYLYPSS